MFNPARAFANQFVRHSAITWLIVGIILSAVDLTALLVAATKEGVLHVYQGVGLLNNYALFSNLLANAIFLYLAKKLVEGVCSIKTSKAIVNAAPINESLSLLSDKIKLKRRYGFLLLGLGVVGILAWLSNVSSHLLGDPQVRWGHPVYDSIDHPLSFVASRLHNAYTWMIVLPFVAHVTICTSNQLRQMIAKAANAGALTYDLLNPDQRGGFRFVDKSLIAFNVIVALAYIQITMHIKTFAKANSDHIIAYVVVTLLLLVINRIFLGDIYATIKKLRFDALDKVKDDVYRNSKLSFEILKYCYKSRIRVTPIIIFAIRASAIVVSGILNLGPSVKAFIRV